MRKKRPEAEDQRKVVIYARKSKVTHKGDSIANQEEYCKEYARLHLNLPDDYEYDIYEDEGKSGFYSDRPDFQRMIHDVERRKIKAIVCYKLDRISRKMSDLTNMIDFLNKYDVALLISSNNLNTKDSNSKMMIQMLGMIAEFERDILTERIQDNLSELSKDGRWMGGITPTGFTTERSKTGRGKSKNSYTYLVPIPEERDLVQHIYDLFLKKRAFNATANALNEEGRKTKTGAQFTMLAVKDIIRNPVYCIADEKSYQYFLDEGCNIYGDKEEYDGLHGISVYNRTEQTKEESDDSTFLRPEFTKMTTLNGMGDWIIAPGRHVGFIASEDWIEAQKIKEEIADKYNRPHRSTNALLSGLIYCPLCHKKLNVIPESNRYTNGKPRFKYACPNAIRKGPCGFQAVRGVEMDEYIIDRLSHLEDGDDRNYITEIQNEIRQLLIGNQTEQDIESLKKTIDKLEKEIKIQVRSLRDANDATRPYIQADIDDLASEIEEKKKILHKLDEKFTEKSDRMKDLEDIVYKAQHFEELIKGKEPEVVISVIKSIVDRVYVTQEGDQSKCHLFIKGNDYDSYDDFFAGSDASENGGSDMCDSEGYRELHPHLRRNPA